MPVRVTIKGPIRIKGSIKVPADKSVSHRSLILSAMATGESRIEGLLESKDVLSTLSCLTRLGVGIEKIAPGCYRVDGLPSGGLMEPKEVLDCGNSGTTVRLLVGLVSAHPMTCVFAGDRSLSERPMGRVVGPLSMAGATFLGRAGNSRLPLTVRGGTLKPTIYTLPVASAQVKSCLLLAGLGSSGTWRITEPAPTRDHTERMLEGSGVVVWREGRTIEITGPQSPRSGQWTVVGDISSAAFFLVAGLLAAEPEVTIEGVSLNPTRTGILDVVEAMGGQCRVTPGPSVSGEPQGTLLIRPSELEATQIGGELIGRLVDEIPILAVAATLARGQTRISDAAELRKKECDRIHAMTTELAAMGARIKEEADGFTIDGVTGLTGARVSSHDDHRVAMALAVAGLAAQGTTTIEHAECVDISYPGFFEDLRRMTGEGHVTIE